MVKVSLYFLFQDVGYFFNWHIRSYTFQVCNIMVWYLYILQDYHHSNSSVNFLVWPIITHCFKFFLWWGLKICSLSNFQVYSTMLTIITMLYIRSLECIHLGILYLWMKSPHLPNTQPVGTNILPSYILLSNQSGNTNYHFKIEGC